MLRPDPSIAFLYMNPMIQVLIKLGLSILLGGAIGLEREFGHKPAGLRTNILICLGSTMMMALVRAHADRQAAELFDPLRVAAGVITGMGFIGAGTVIRASGHIHGLTTASTVWAVTGLGLVIGAGYYGIAVLFAAVVVVTLIVFRKIEQILPRKIGFQYVLDGQGPARDPGRVERGGPQARHPPGRRRPEKNGGGGHGQLQFQSPATPSSGNSPAPSPPSAK